MSSPVPSDVILIVPFKVRCVVRALCVLVASLLASGTAVLWGQPVSTSPTPPSPPPIQVQGSVGAATEAYSSSAPFGRRDPSSARLFARATATTPIGLFYGLDLMASTEQVSTRQRMNRLGMTFGYRWARLTVGDASPVFSTYNLNGVTLRGGLLRFTPGRSILALTAGRVRRPIEFTAESALRGHGFERWIYGAQIGVGRRQATHVHVSTVYGRDRVRSLDSLAIRPPSANLNFTPDVGIRALKGALMLEARTTISAYTRDLRNPEVDDFALPFGLWGPFEPRAGSVLARAMEAGANLTYTRFGLRLGFTRIEPNFESLGLTQVRSDQQTFRVQPRFRLFQRRLRLTGQYLDRRNNLFQQRNATLSRSQLGVQAQMRFTPGFLLGGSFTQITRDHEPVEAEQTGLQQRHVIQLATLSPTFIVRRTTLSHTVMLTGALQTLTDQSTAVEAGDRLGADFDNANASLTYVLALLSGATVRLGGSILLNESTLSTLSATGIDAGVGLVFLERALTLNIGGGWGRTVTEVIGFEDPRFTAQQLRIQVQSGYRFPFGDTVRFTLRSLSNRPNPGEGFQEVLVQLRYEHPF